MQKREIDVDEDLPNFFKVLRPVQAQQMITETDNIKNEYNLEIQDSGTISKLKQMHWPAKTITGTPFYDILSNNTYADSFCYIGAHIPEREKLIEDGDDDDGDNCEQSDMVQVLLNLGAVNDEVAQHISFGKGFRRTFKGRQLAYMEQFEQRYGIKWEHENERLVANYLTYKRTRMALYFNLHNSAKTGKYINFNSFKSKGNDIGTKASTFA